MENSSPIVIVDPKRPTFFKDLPFTLSKEQSSYIKNNQIASALCSGVSVDVIQAFINNPENLALI